MRNGRNGRFSEEGEFDAFRGLTTLNYLRRPSFETGQVPVNHASKLEYYHASN